MSTVEPEWDETERAWILALHLYKGDICSGCGGRWSETTDQSNEDAYLTDAIRCHSCTARSVAQDNAQNVAHPSAVYRIVRRVDGDKDDQS